MCSLDFEMRRGNNHDKKDTLFTTTQNHFTSIGFAILGMIRAEGGSFMREAVFSVPSGLGSRIFGPLKA